MAEKIKLNEKQLKQLISESIKRILNEWKSRQATLHLLINGQEFVQNAMEFLDSKINVMEDPAIKEIAENEFYITAIWGKEDPVYEPGPSCNPGGEWFDIDDDEGLDGLIDEIREPEVRKVFKMVYEKMVENGDFE